MLIIYKNNHKANSQTDRPTRVERLHAKRIEEKSYLRPICFNSIKAFYSF